MHRQSMENKKSLSEQFCHDILGLGINRSKATANLVVAMSSYQDAESLVELSLSPLYHYQFSSVFKSTTLLARDNKEYELAKAQILDLCLEYAPINKRISLQTDATPIEKKYSSTLEERQYINIPNTVIKGNKPITIGYPLSSINLSCESNWSLPLVRSRVPLDQTESTQAVKQLQSLIPQLCEELDCDLVVNKTDSTYTHAAYLSPLYEQDKLVCISRFRYRSKVYTPAKGDNPKGAPKIYQDCFYLLNETQIARGVVKKTGTPYEKVQTSIHELPHDETLQFEAVTKKGKLLKIELYRWNDLKLRSKKGHCMKHKPFDLVGVQVTNVKTGKALYKRQMFFGIFGKQKQQITTKESYEEYRGRYDIEPSFRFNKQNLFLDKYLCEDVQHLDNFFLINQLANWLLYTAADDVQFIPRKWEVNKSAPVEKTEKLSIAKTHRSVERLFLTFDKKPFLPKPAKKGKGNIKQKRSHFPVVKKPKNKP